MIIATTDFNYFLIILYCFYYYINLKLSNKKSRNYRNKCSKYVRKCCFNISNIYFILNILKKYALLQNCNDHGAIRLYYMSIYWCIALRIINVAYLSGALKQICNFIPTPTVRHERLVQFVQFTMKIELSHPSVVGTAVQNNSDNFSLHISQAPDDESASPCRHLLRFTCPCTLGAFRPVNSRRNTFDSGRHSSSYLPSLYCVAYFTATEGKSTLRRGHLLLRFVRLVHWEQF